MINSINVRKIFTLTILSTCLCTSAIGQKAAIISFYADKKINTESLGKTANENAKLLSSLTGLVDDPNFNLDPILQDFYSRFFNDFAPNFPFQVLPEDQVIENDDYVNYVPAWQKEFEEAGNKYQERMDTATLVGKLLTQDPSEKNLAKNTLPANGYKILQLAKLFKQESPDKVEMTKIFKDIADGIMEVSLYYQFAPIGVGKLTVSARVEAVISIILWNTKKKRKQVFWILENGSSKGIIPAPGGIPIVKTDKMLELCKQASDKLLADLSKKGKMKKIVKKAAKKFK